jgi:hypothetical protein
MNKKMLIFAIVILSAILASSFFLRLPATHETIGSISSHDQVPAVGSETEKRLAPKQSDNRSDAEMTMNNGNSNLDEFSDSPFNATVGENTRTEVSPLPDGRIYYPNSEAPFGYTPTHSPKEPMLPIAPDDSEN